MPNRPCRSPRCSFRHHAPLHLLPLAAALLGAALPPPLHAAAAPTAIAAATPAWWASFDDPLLRELMGRSAVQPAPLFRSYVEMRVALSKLDISARLHDLAAQQVARLEQRGADDGQALQAAWQRARQFAQLLQAVESDADHRLATLAALAHEDADALRQRLLATPEGGALPQTRTALPLAEPRPLRSDDPASVPRELARLTLIDAAARERRAQALLQAAQLQLEAARLRASAQGDDDAATEAELQLLLQAARTVAERGALALAWSQWLLAGGAQQLALAR